MDTLPLSIDATLTFVTGRVYCTTREHTIECRVMDIDLDRGIVYVAFRDKVRMIAGLLAIPNYDEDDITAQDILESYDRGNYDHLPYSKHAQLFDRI